MRHNGFILLLLSVFIIIMILVFKFQIERASGISLDQVISLFV